MKTEKPHSDLPYLVCACDEPKRYFIQCKCDKKHMGYILQLEDGWEIEEQLEPPRPTRYVVEPPKPLRFRERHEAALFVCMRDRVFERTIDNIGDPLKSLKIRITPNFGGGRWLRCSRGQWVASIWDGEEMIDIGCADSLQAAKREGLLKAYYGTPSPTEGRLEEMSSDDWPETADQTAS